MTLPDGLYTLKASPIVEFYATNNGLNEIVTIVEKTPSTAERQIASTLCFSSTFLIRFCH